MSTVLYHLRMGESRWDIANATGFSPKQVAYTICNLRRDGYYNQPLDERVAQWRESVSRGRGGIWVAIRDYAPLQMSPLEIREAVLLRDQSALDLSKINNALSKARTRGFLERRTPQEELDIAKDSKRPLKDIQKRVGLWLEVLQILEERALKDVPHGRGDWITLARFLRERRNPRRKNHSLFNDVFNAPFTELPHLDPCYEAVKLSVPQTDRIINIKTGEVGTLSMGKNKAPSRDPEGLLTITFPGDRPYSGYTVKLPPPLLGQNYQELPKRKRAN